MTDPRVAKLADLIVNYSLELKAGSLVRIDGGTVAAPFVRELYRAALNAGANRRTKLEVEGTDVIDVNESSDEQLTFVSEIDHFEVENLDAIVTIWADRNTRALSQPDPGRLSKRISSRRQLTKRFWERIDEAASGSRPTASSTCPTARSSRAPSRRRRKATSASRSRRSSRGAGWRT
jgi:aminopeptidase